VNRNNYIGWKMPRAPLAALCTENDRLRTNARSPDGGIQPRRQKPAIKSRLLIGSNLSIPALSLALMDPVKITILVWKAAHTVVQRI